MESNMFTEEQLEILRKGFQEHDFTQEVPLSLSYEDMTPKQAAAFVALKKRIMDYAKANLPSLDIKRKPGNFTGDFPVNLLLEADSAYIANEAVNIISDAQRTQDAINQFFDMFGGVVDEAILIYCSRRQKTPDELTDEEEQYKIKKDMSAEDYLKKALSTNPKERNTVPPLSAMTKYFSPLEYFGVKDLYRLASIGAEAENYEQYKKDASKFFKELAEKANALKNAPKQNKQPVNANKPQNEQKEDDNLM